MNTASGCSSVTVPAATFSPELRRLASSGRGGINVVVASELNAAESVGSQFALIALPLGAIYSEDPASRFDQQLTELLAFSGIKVTHSPALDGRAAQTLHISIRSLQLTAYDILVVRRIYCRVKVKVDFATPTSHRVYNFDYDHAEFRRMGFETELTEHLDETFSRLAGEIASTILGGGGGVL